MEHGRRTHIPNRLRKHRKMMGYTQKEVARLLGLAGSDRISQWEQGLKYPSVVNLIKLSVIYHVFPTDLYYDLMKAVREEIEERMHPPAVQDTEASSFL